MSLERSKLVLLICLKLLQDEKIARKRHVLCHTSTASYNVTLCLFIRESTVN